MDLLTYNDIAVFIGDTAMANGHAAAETVVVTTPKQDEQQLAAERAMCIEMMRRQMEQERERRRALIAEVSLSITRLTYVCSAQDLPFTVFL